MTPVENPPRRQYTLEEKFQACVDIIHALPKTGPAPVTYVAMLAMYGLYKQVTEGPNKASKPGFWNPEGRAKWDAWTRVGDMSREEAMELYVACVLEAIDIGSETLDWGEMLSKYSHYYEDLGFLRENFRIIDRELIKEDGTQVSLTMIQEQERLAAERRARNGPTDLERLKAGPYTIEEKFQACVDIIKAMPKSAYLDDIRSVLSKGEIGSLGPMPTNFAEMFTMYALYKQATIGQCNTNKPFWNIVERYKWEAWFRLGETSKEQAMAGYVVGVLEKIDYCAANFDWDEMLQQYEDDYERLEPILREKFRILDRELIKEDGTRVIPEPFHNRIIGILSFNFDRAKGRKDIAELHKAEPLTGSEMLHTPADPGSDAEYFDVRDDHIVSRRSSSSLEDPEPSQVKSMKTFLAKMDAELRAVKTAIGALTKASDARHHSILMMIKRSSRLSWRSLFFFLVWPIIFNWVVKYFRGPTIV